MKRLETSNVWLLSQLTVDLVVTTPEEHGSSSQLLTRSLEKQLQKQLSLLQVILDTRSFKHHTCPYVPTVLCWFAADGPTCFSQRLSKADTPILALGEDVRRSLVTPLLLKTCVKSNPKKVIERLLGSKSFSLLLFRSLPLSRGISSS